MSSDAFVVKTDPTINKAHGMVVEQAIGSELYERTYDTVDPIGGSSPSGRLDHADQLADE